MSHAITNEILRSVSLELEEVFDSHALICAVMRQYPREYTTDLYGFVSSADPIQSLHASIGQRLLGIDSIEATARKVPSLNVRGQVTDNQEWRRK